MTPWAAAVPSRWRSGQLDLSRDQELHGPIAKAGAARTAHAVEMTTLPTSTTSHRPRVRRGSALPSPVHYRPFDRPAAVVTVAAMLLLSCGSDDDDSAAAPPTTPAASEQPPSTVRATPTS